MTAFRFSLNDFTLSFLSVLFEGFPFLVFGTLVSGVIDAFVPPAWFRRAVPRNRVVAVALSGLFGLVFPLCECGIVPVMRRLIRKGVPAACAVTYMLAAPIVNPITLLSTLAAFQGQGPWWMASLRLGLGYVVAAGAGLLVLRVRPEAFLRHASADLPGEGSSDDGDSLPMRARFARAVRCSASDFLDVAAFLVMGAAIAAVFNTAVSREIIVPLASSAPLAVGSLMGGAVVLSLCSTSDAFIAATLNQFPFASKLAFLVFGPVFDLKLAFMYNAVFRTWFVGLLALGTGAAIFWICVNISLQPF
ncbi:MAG TPA: permease [Verrucomicrobiae bacterium]|nr:permease [Verrucomicrobiae bacterium]